MRQPKHFFRIFLGAIPRRRREVRPKRSQCRLDSHSQSILLFHKLYSNMEFEKSSQAKYFMFDDHEALMACKQDASEIRSLRRKPERDNHHTAQSTKLAPQSFACGYQRNWDEQRVGRSSIALHVQTIENSCVRSTPLPSMATSDQEILIHFHAHQLQRLIGPNAVFPELRRSASTLSTAIMLFRRFYLSNSIIDFPGRPMAAAAALLATKADCDSSLSVSPLHLSAGWLFVVVVHFGGVGSRLSVSKKTSFRRKTDFSRFATRFFTSISPGTLSVCRHQIWEILFY